MLSVEKITSVCEEILFASTMSIAPFKNLFYRNHKNLSNDKIYQTCCKQYKKVFCCAKITVKQEF